MRPAGGRLWSMNAAHVASVPQLTDESRVFPWLPRWLDIFVAPVQMDWALCAEAHSKAGSLPEAQAAEVWNTIYRYQQAAENARRAALAEAPSHREVDRYRLAAAWCESRLREIVGPHEPEPSASAIGLAGVAA